MLRKRTATFYFIQSGMADYYETRPPVGEKPLTLRVPKGSFRESSAEGPPKVLLAEFVVEIEVAL